MRKRKSPTTTTDDAEEKPKRTRGENLKGGPGVTDRMLPNGIRTWSASEVTEQLAFVEQLMLTRSLSQARAVSLCREKFGFARGRYLNLQKRVREQWRTEDEADQPSARSVAIRGINAMLRVAEGVRTPDGRGWERLPDHAAVRGYQSLLMDLQATRAPIQLNVHHEVSTAINDVIGNLTPEQLQDALDEWNELQRNAEAYKAMLPEAAE